MQEKLYYTCKVWGFVKYYHSEVSICNVNWDSVLLAVLPDVRSAANSTEFNDALMEMLNAAGTMALSTTYFPDTLAPELKRNRDWSWISTPTLRSDVQSILDTIKNNFRPHASCWYRLNTSGSSFGFSGGYFLFPFDSLGLNLNTTIAFPDENQRMLMFFKYWNIVRYFNPYNYVLDTTWDSTLNNYVAQFLYVTNAYDMYTLYLKLSATLNDAHVHGFTYSKYQQPYPGVFRPYIRLKYLHGDYVVLKSLVPGISKGDVIISVDGLTTNQLEDSFKQYYSYGNQSVLRRILCEHILSKNYYGASESIVAMDSTGIYNTVTTTCVSPGSNLSFFYDDYYYTDSLSSKEWALMPCNIGYVNMDKLQIVNVASMYSQLQNTTALIFDFRNGLSSAIIGAIATTIYPNYVEFAKFTMPNPAYPGTYYWAHQFIGNASNPTPYGGKIIILMNESTQSASEFSSMALEKMPDVVKIGSQTAGADGNVTFWRLSEDLNVGITTLGVYYPNGDSTQRIGIVPDVVAYPTIEGIRHGRDEVLEKALVAGGCNLKTEEKTKARLISVGPNPVKNYLNIDLPAGTSNYTIKLSDIDGRVLRQEEVVRQSTQTAIKFDVSFYDPGIYLLSVTSDNKTSNLKIIKI